MRYRRKKWCILTAGHVRVARELDGGAPLQRRPRLGVDGALVGVSLLGGSCPVGDLHTAGSGVVGVHQREDGLSHTQDLAVRRAADLLAKGVGALRGSLVAGRLVVPVLHDRTELVDLAPSRNAAVSKPRLVRDGAAKRINVGVVQIVRDALLLAVITTDMSKVEIVCVVIGANDIEAALRNRKIQYKTLLVFEGVGTAALHGLPDATTWQQSATRKMQGSCISMYSFISRTLVYAPLTS